MAAGWPVMVNCTAPQKQRPSYDLSLGKSFGENWNVRFTALNFTNTRYMLDNSNTFGGTHYVNPRLTQCSDGRPRPS